jgi:hypothetical protein
MLSSLMAIASVCSLLINWVTISLVLVLRMMLFLKDENALPISLA